MENNNNNLDILFIRIYKKINDDVNDSAVAPFEGLTPEEKFTFLAKAFFVFGRDLADVFDALQEVKNLLEKDLKD